MNDTIKQLFNELNIALDNTKKRVKNQAIKINMAQNQANSQFKEKTTWQ